MTDPKGPKGPQKTIFGYAAPDIVKPGEQGQVPGQQGQPMGGLPPNPAAPEGGTGHQPNQAWGQQPQQPAWDPQQGQPQPGQPQPGQPQQGHPQPGHPQPGHPQQGQPQQAWDPQQQAPQGQAQQGWDPQQAQAPQGQQQAWGQQPGQPQQQAWDQQQAHQGQAPAQGQQQGWDQQQQAQAYGQQQAQQGHAPAQGQQQGWDQQQQAQAHGQQQAWEQQQQQQQQAWGQQQQQGQQQAWGQQQGQQQQGWGQQAAAGLPASPAGTLFGINLGQFYETSFQRKALLYCGIGLVIAAFMPLSFSPFIGPWNGGDTFRLLMWPLIAGGAYLLVAAAPPHIREKVPPIVLQWLPFGVAFASLAVVGWAGPLAAAGGAMGLITYAFPVLAFGMLLRASKPDDPYGRWIVGVAGGAHVWPAIWMVTHLSFGAGLMFTLLQIATLAAVGAAALCVLFIPPLSMNPKFKFIDAFAPLITAILLIYPVAIAVIFTLGMIMDGAVVGGILIGARMLLYVLSFFGVLLLTAPPAYEAIKQQFAGGRGVSLSPGLHNPAAHAQAHAQQQAWNQAQGQAQQQGQPQQGQPQQGQPQQGQQGWNQGGQGGGWPQQ